MRRKIGRILAPVMAAMLVFGGCGNKTADRVTENQTHKTENESNEPVEKEPAEDEDELKEENQEEQNTQDQETDVSQRHITKFRKDMCIKKCFVAGIGAELYSITHG